MTRANVFIVLILTLATYRASAQTSDTSLAGDISAVQTEIRKADEEDQGYSGGLVKSLISLRLATLRQTLALLDQRLKTGAARTTLLFTIDGKPFLAPTDAPAQIAAVDKELADVSAKIAKQEAEVARYSGGLVQATAMATLATLRQTRAMLEQRRLALKYGLPQFVGFTDRFPSTGSTAAHDSPLGTAAASADAPSGRQAEPLPPASDCMKTVFGSFCLGAAASTLPANAARKSDDLWIYAEPQPTGVTIVQGRVAVVARFYKPGTWLTYRNLEGDLIKKYGKGKDLSFFPSYADDPSSRETAITLKKGRAVQSWQQPGFTVQLKWESEEHVALLYFHDELEAKRATEKKDQY